MQVDPVLGGTPNAYVYVLDPVNSHDYSGLCFSCLLQPAGAGGRSLQASVGRNQQQLVKVTGRLRVSTPRVARKSIARRSLSVQNRSTTNKGYSRSAVVLSIVGDATSGVSKQASVYGRQLQQGSSTAGRYLRVTGRLAKNPVVRVVGAPAFAIVGAGIEGHGNHLDGDSVGRNVLETGGGVAGGAAGAAAGGFACGTATVVTFGLGAATCPVFIGGLGAAGSWAGNELGELTANVLHW